MKAGVKQVVYASTGGALYGEPQYLPCDEAHPINPLSPYGASKHTVEKYLNVYRANCDLQYTVLRYPNVYGPRQSSHAEGGVIAIFADRMARNEPLTIYGTGQQERDFIYVGDVVEGLLLLGAAESAPGEVVNLEIGIGDLSAKTKVTLRSECFNKSKKGSN